MSHVNYNDIPIPAKKIQKESKELLNDVLKMKKHMDSLSEKYRCNHIWFISKIDHYSVPSEELYEYTCAKCGSIQSLGEKIVGIVNGETTQYYLDVKEQPSSVTDAYKKLMKSNPNITDKEAAELLEEHIKRFQNKWSSRNRRPNRK